MTMMLHVLEMRRDKLCLKFSKKDIKSEKTLFNVVTNPVRTRGKGKKGFKGVAYLTWPRCSTTNETSSLSNLMLPVDYWDRAQQMVLWITYLSHKFVVHLSAYYSLDLT